MKVTTNAEPLFDHATAAFYAAADDTLKLAIEYAPKRTGEYARTLKVWRRKRKDRPTATIGSRKAPQTGVLERGGWTRHGRGVHIARANAPRPISRATEQFAKLYEARLRRMPIGAASYTYHGPDERGPSEGILVGER